jgi:MFS transporter, DHA1 family, tetracycline resistance protein
MVADLTPQAHRTNGMAAMSSTLALGSILGSVVLAVTAEAGLETGFAILASLGVLASVLVACFVRTQSEPVGRLVERPSEPLRFLWPNFLATLAGYTAYAMIVPLHGLRLLDQGALTSGQANARAGLILTAGAFALLLAQTVISVMRQPNPERLFRIGSAGALFGFAILASAQTVTSMAVSVILISACLGAAVSSNLALISLRVDAGYQGRAAGANAAMRALGIALGPLLGLGLYQPGGILPFVVGFSMVVVVVMASLRA